MSFDRLSTYLPSVSIDSVVWDESTKFHGAALIKLTFPTPQKVIGAELYSTNYESFGTNARVVGVPQSGGVTASKSIPVRTVFLAHGDEEQCFEHNKITAHPCSTEDGKPVYAEAASCTAFKRGVTKTFSLTSSCASAVQPRAYMPCSPSFWCHGVLMTHMLDRCLIAQPKTPRWTPYRGTCTSRAPIWSSAPTCTATS